jgi:hypothetical protein
VEAHIRSERACVLLADQVSVKKVDLAGGVGYEVEHEKSKTHKPVMEPPMLMTWLAI